jgi:hypothetical protein
MKLTKLKSSLLLTAFSAVAAYQVSAATDGVLSASSSGSLDITFSVDVAGIIVDLEDFNFGNWSGSGELRDNDDLCIGTTGTAEYIIRADGQGAGNNFVLSNGSNELAYRVFWNDTIGTAGNFELAAGVQSTNMTNPPNTFSTTDGINYTCTGDRDANVEVVIDEAALQGAEAGAYSGVLTLTMVPQ